MVDLRGNGNYQNTVPNTNNDFNPYQNQYFGQNDKGTSYMQGMNSLMPRPMPGNNREDVLYPIESSLATPFLNIPVPEASSTNTFAEGGRAQKNKKKERNNPYPALAEMIRQQGKGEDTILAHINPLEAMMLHNIGGSGTINPKTGLPQFGFFSNPGKWLKSVVGPAVGTVVGNMILPGIGGVIGGGLGGAFGSKVRGRKDAGQAALRGAAMGAIAPTAASLAGSGLRSLGATNIGGGLSQYGTTNAILPALGMGSRSSTTANTMGNNMPLSGLSAGDDESGNEPSFIDSLMGKSKNFFSEPANLLTTGVLANALFNRPKEKSPEKLGEEEKRRAKALRFTPEELAQKEAYDLAVEHARRRNERKKFLPEERLNIEPLYTRTNTPEEYGRTGRWLNYYNNPEHTGNPVMMKEGGEANPKGFLEIEEFEYPVGLGTYLKGETGGQDDKIPAFLSDGEYVIPADSVSHLGDGNNTAGAKKLDMMIQNIRKHKGSSIKLPPKAKSLTDYMRV